MSTTHPCDLAIVGGGLAGGLIALAVAAKRPDLRVRLVEGGETLGGNRLWSFFGSDVAREDRWLLDRLVSHAWPDYDVRFPAFRRTLAQPYYSIGSDRFDRVLRDTLAPDTVMTGRKVLAVSPTAAVLADGDRVEAKGVIDARGPADLSWLSCGWQKFVGLEIETAAPHGLDRPIVMDAAVEQQDGFRFVYALPFSATRVFVEDTYYSDTRRIDQAVLAARVSTYAATHGWRVERVLREEAGALPVVIHGDFERYWASGGKGVAKAGARAGLFHPTTSYSLPDAVRLAVRVAAAPEIGGAALHSLTHAHAKAAWDARGFYRMLDKMLFRAADPGERWRVLERFYRLDPKLIGRFYAAQSTTADKARVLMGRPPVPLGRALKVLAA